ncbi:MAG TPA: hypothetical protein VGC15_04140 [Acetobacteraceae bacterium]
MDVDAAFRNTVQQLQQEPQRYRLFGVYWWIVKKLLKAAGYDREQLYMLGDYEDPETAAMVPVLPLVATLEAAFTEYGQNARFPHTGGMVENPDGELVRLFDEDAGL